MKAIKIYLFIQITALLMVSPVVAMTENESEITKTVVDYALGANQTTIAERLSNKQPSTSIKIAQKLSVNQPGQPIAQATLQAFALAADHGASADARIERFTGTIVGNVYRQWDFSVRDNAIIYRVRFDSSNKTEVFKRSEKQDAVRKYWSTVKSTNPISDLDRLVMVAQQKVVEAGLTPTEYTYLKYTVAGPRVPETAPRETLEVFLEIAGEEKDRRALFHDRRFQRLTPVKIIKVHIPAAAKIPQPEMPTIEIPEVNIPEISDPNIRVQENEQFAVLTMWSDVLFDFDKWNIRMDAEEGLRQILEVLTNRYAQYPFEIHAHTDSMGKEAYNVNLSQHRANSVKEWFVTHGIQEERASIYPHGELQPVAPNNNADGTDNPEGRQKNRRVEIRILKQFTNSIPS